MKKPFAILILLALVATPSYADVTTRSNLNRALANSLYCQLAGCTMTGNFVPNASGAYLGADYTYGATWHSGVSAYVDASTGNALTLFDTRAMAATVGPYLSFAAKTTAGGVYTDLAAISGQKLNATEANTDSQLVFQYNSGGSPVMWYMNTTNFNPSNDNTINFGGSANQLKTIYAGTSVIVGATGTTLAPTGLTKYNNINTAGSGVGPIYGSVALATQAASIGTTNLYASAPVGMYRICWRQKITRAATTSSSLLVTFTWNDGAARTSTMWMDPVAGTTGTTADATNTTTGARGNCMVIYSAAAQNITYATTYASSGATTMQYSLDITIEKLN